MTMPDELGAGLADALTGAEGTQQQGAPTPPASTDPSAASVQSGSASYDTTGLSPYVQNWLASLPEDKRAAAAEYARDWDTKGFQPFAQQQAARLQPYVQLGSVEELQQLTTVFEQMKADPNGFVRTLIDNGFVDPSVLAAPQTQQAPPQQYYDAQGNPIQVPAVGSTPPDIAAHPQFKRMETALGAMAQKLAAQEQMREQQQADQMLEQATLQAEAKYGQFNRLYVYQLMTNGLTIDAAVQAWKNEVAQAAAQQQRPPAVMGATSAPPAAPGPLNTSEDRANALAQWLSQSQS